MNLSFDKCLFLFFLVGLPLFLFPSFTLSAETDKKEAAIIKDNFQINLPGQTTSEMSYFDQKSVKKIQESLKSIGYDVGEAFGLIDKKTSAAVRKFREDFEIVSDDLFSDHLISTLFHYAEVAKIHPDWKDITLSKSFTNWINKQPTKDQVRISKLRRSGSSKQIITLLNDYKSDQKKEKSDLKSTKNKVKKTELESKPKKETTEIDDASKMGSAKNLPEIALKPEAKKEETQAKTEVKKEEPTAASTANVTMKTGPESISKPVTEEKKSEPEIMQNNPSVKDASEQSATETSPPDLDVQQATPPEMADASDSKENPASSEAMLSDEEASFQTILEQAKDLKSFDASKVITWEGDNCGCLLDLSGKTIYGFYPFWLSGKPQKINFSLLSRVAYYALSFDSKGEMSPLLHWHPRDADFVTEAQRYRTKVDLVIYKKDWTEWFHFSTKDQFFVIDKTTSNIVRAVDQKMPNTLENRAKSLVGSTESMTMGDGVTLYFDQYPEDSRAVDFFTSFVETLRKKLKAANPNYKLNLMLPMDGIGRGIYAYKNLEKLMGLDPKVAGDDLVDLFLVMLKEPTTRWKKTLRLSFEKTDEFKGLARKNILRKIVPVISPLGHEPDQYKQFEDDLIYFEDNFGGVGFWPLPLASQKDAKIVEQAVSEVFVKKTDLEFVQRMIPEATFSPCKWICPNRWYFRLAYDLLFFLLFIYGLVALRSPALRNFFNQHRPLFILIFLSAIVILYSAVMCDPYLNGKKDEVTLALILVGVFFWIWRNYIQMKEAEYP